VRSKEKVRSHLVPHRRARSASAISRSRKCGQFGAIFRPEGFAGLQLRLRPNGLALRATPFAPSKVASRHLLDVASTPPFQGGEGCSQRKLAEIQTDPYQIELL
jgi:hypothetical protein